MPYRNRDRFQQLMVVVFFVFGVAASLIPGASGTVLSSFPLPARYLFTVWLAVSSFVTLWGMWRSRSAVGVLTERAGLLMLGSLFLIYASWAAVLFGSKAFGFALILTGLAVASYLRVWDIGGARRDVTRGRS